MASEKQPVSDADAAYAHAVEVCNRLVLELEAQLPPNYESRRNQDVRPAGSCDKVQS